MYQLDRFTVILDYAHNPHGVKALTSFVKTFDCDRVGVITGVGDRRDEEIISLGEEAAKIIDEIIIRLKDMPGRIPAKKWMRLCYREQAYITAFGSN
ncbi:MAG: glutamate ligase domain-containing protein [Chitinophagaceae bacterium]